MNFRSGEFSTGTTGNFQTELTEGSCGGEDRRSAGPSAAGHGNLSYSALASLWLVLAWIQYR